MRRIPILLSLSFISAVALADTYWVAFADKKGTADITLPKSFLSQRALDRRTKQNIAIDSLDLPVSPVYIDSLRLLGAKILFPSRWHNGVTVQTDSTIAVRLSALPFVTKIERTQRENIQQSTRRKLPSVQQETSNPYGTTKTQTEMLHLQPLHEAGYQGKGMYIAVVDNGFPKVNTSTYFDSVRSRILYTRNLIDAATDVYSVGDHGSCVLSCMAAYKENTYCGTAIEASYCLIVTEDDDTESWREIDAQVAAFELADSLGADIITTSLGYYAHFDDPSMDFQYAMLDGKTLRNSRAATVAARKGMIVCVAAGNEGNDAWHYITAPADADSILAVGSVTSTGIQSNFSSFGPAADGRVKPDVCAMGTSTSLYNPSSDGLAYSNGTSFSTPQIAGAVACLWQALPNLNNMQIIERIRTMSSQFDAPNDSLGYGIPDMWSAYMGEKTAVENIEAEPIETIEAETELYTLQGQRVENNHNLPQGVYIKRQGSRVEKVKL